MKHTVAKLLDEAVMGLADLAAVAGDLKLEHTVERTRDASHGDFASNVAMRLAKPARKSPREIASRIVDALGGNDQVEKVDIAGPGFINFHMSASSFHAELRRVLESGSQYGIQEKHNGPSILLEFVSTNPTGPLHVGHGRLAAYGATLGNLLEATGHTVFREYYVNDAGRQMDILGASIWLRWIEGAGVAVPFPRAGYQGGYVTEMARSIDTDGIELPTLDAVLDGVAGDGTDDDAPEEALKRETYVSTLIEKAKQLAGHSGFERIRQQGLASILADIKDDLTEFGVTFDRWFSEQSLTDNNRIEAALAVLKERDMLYVKDGATWFPATQFGDEKDRVVVRENGLTTYFASDIAYHFDKRERGYGHLIDILGADHHGYVSRVQAGLEAMGYKGDDLEVELIQFVSLYRGGQKVQMSTRSGNFDTLRKLRAEVGNDAARFYYVMRSNDQHLDFDLDVATSQSNDNPVYYIQYAHARIARVFRKADELDLSWNPDTGSDNLQVLLAEQERALLTAISRYPEILELAAKNRAPQTLVHYLRDLVSDFHSCYNAHKVLVDDAGLRNARLSLYAAVKIVVANALSILGVSAPEEM